MESPLAIWLNNRLRERGWSVREAARRGGVSHTAFFNILQERGRPMPETYQALARAFGTPLEEILIVAGFLPKPPPAVAEEREILFLLRSLPEGKRENAIAMLRGLAGVAAPPVPPQAAQDEEVCTDNRPADCPLRIIEESPRETKEQILETMYKLLGNPAVAQLLIEESERILRARQQERERCPTGREDTPS